MGLLISFWLPWAHLVGQSLSGFDLQKLRGTQTWLWIIPVASVVTISAAITGQCQRIAARFTGTIPFFILAYWLKHLGGDALRVLGLGAWLSLAFGLVLLILPHRPQGKVPSL